MSYEIPQHEFGLGMCMYITFYVYQKICESKWKCLSVIVIHSLINNFKTLLF